MARIVCDEITFDSLSKEVQKALNLLLQHKEEALTYWTKGNGYWTCPLQKAYGLRLPFRVWKQYETGVRGSVVDGSGIPPDFGTLQKLTELGWTSNTFNAFMKWFEADDLPEHYMGETNILRFAERNNRHEFLKKFLSGEVY